MSDAGLRIVQNHFVEAAVDKEWSIRHERGYTWWGGGLAQHIWADPPDAIGGMERSRLHARTDFLTGFSGTQAQLEALSVLSPFASLSGFIQSTDHPGTIQLAASISAHNDIEPWCRRLFSLAAATQVAEAHILAQPVAETAFFSPAVSPHPTSGFRDTMDDMLDVIDIMVAPEGLGPSRYIGTEMLDAVQLLETPPCVLVTGDTAGLTAEFPFPSHTSMLQISTDEPHPRFGSGCLIRILTYVPDPPDLAAHALALNERDISSGTHNYFFGSWLPYKSGLAFVCFMPNCLHREGMLTNFVKSTVRRIGWLTEDVLGYSMMEHFAEAQEDVVRRSEAFLAVKAGQVRP